MKPYIWISDTIRPQMVNSAGLLGFGAMGCEIAWLLNSCNIPTFIQDPSENALKMGFEKILDLYQQQIKENNINLLSVTDSYRGFQDIDFVFESISEDLNLKKALFIELEGHLKRDAIIASNTSSFTIEQMADSMRYPERLIGMHFFNPPHRMELVEIVPGKNTSLETVATAIHLCKKMGKIPIIVGDCPGFLINRIFMMGAMEIFQLLEEGISIIELDKLMVDFGLPIGPFVLFDEVGIDLIFKIIKELIRAYKLDRQVSPTLQRMYESGLWGKKVGKGFYIYSERGNCLTSQKIINKEEILHRMLLPMINEAARILEENFMIRGNYLLSPELIDSSFILATEFPSCHGGLLRYADTIGISFVIDTLKHFENQHGKRFTPCNFLLDLQRKGRKFYQ